MDVREATEGNVEKGRRLAGCSRRGPTISIEHREQSVEKGELLDCAVDLKAHGEKCWG